MSDEDNGVSAGEQAAFCEAHDLIRRLIKEHDFSPVDVGTGVLIAQISGWPKTTLTLFIPATNCDASASFGTCWRLKRRAAPSKPVS